MSARNWKVLFETVREVCPRGLWAKGIKLCDSDGVFQESDDADEITLRVTSPGLLVSPTVVLYPVDQEWDCDCGSRAEACAHVAACVAALCRGTALPAPVTRGKRINYRFSRRKDVLFLERAVGDEPIEGSIRGVGGAFLSRADLDIDQVIGTSARLRRSQLCEILGLLDGNDRVSFDGAAVYTSSDSVLPIGIVCDKGRGVQLDVVRNPAITEVVGSGIALCGDTLQPLGHTAITGEQLEHLPLSKSVPAEGYASLVTEILPGLAADIPIEIETTRLPEVTSAAVPRIEIEVRQGEKLEVVPSLVYGTPAIARIEGDQMKHLRGPAPMRDRVREKELLAELRDELNLVPGRTVDFFADDAARFTQKLQRWRGESADQAGHDYILPVSLMPLLDLSEGFELTFEADEGGSPKRASGEAVIGAWQSGLELVPLETGGWARLPADWLSKHGDRVADLLAARDEDGKLPKFALPNLAALCDDLGQARPSYTGLISTLVDGFEGISNASLPDDFTGTLREYQQRGVDWLCFLRGAELGGVLADDMGLGKTIQALCSIKGRALVVCPTSVLDVWVAEAKRFRPAMSVATYHGASRTLDPDAELTITTYGLLRIDAKRLRGVDWDTVVLDEAQAIKNPQSQVTRAAHRLSAGFRIALSGTPVENRLDELWSLFQFSNPGLLGDRASFQRRYTRPIARAEAGAAERLRDRIRPFLLRRVKRDVAPEMPPRTDSVIYCELDESERVVYDAIRVATRDTVVSKLREGGSVIAALEALLRLRQAACHSALIPGQTGESSAKVRELLAMLEQALASGHKALVFSQWTSLLNLVEPHLHAAGIEFTRLDGSTRDRGAVVGAFQSESGPPVMLISLKAGGTGLTLTAADHVFMLDPWWNPAVEDQAADRTHRIGQTRPVVVYKLVAKDTVESRIIRLQQSKRDLADAAIGDGDAAEGLTREDLLGLLE